MIILNYKYNSDGPDGGFLIFILVIFIAGIALKMLLGSHEVDKTCINNEYYYVYDGEIFKHKDFIDKACDNSEVKIKSPN